ncbi:MAG: protein translocase subunit SecD [Firmicutes bacterium]|nr:protein translocase subunit SecD [Bacillota bacterium]
MKAKSFLVLLLMLMIAGGLAAISYLGIGETHPKATAARNQNSISMDDFEMVSEVETDENGETVTEVVTEAHTQIAVDENGEVVTGEDGQPQMEPVTDADGNAVGDIVYEEDGKTPKTQPKITYTYQMKETTTEATTAGPGYGSYKNIKQGLDLKGGVSILYQAEIDTPTEEDMRAAVAMLQERVVYMGFYEAEVSQEGVNRVRVEIPGVDDSEAVAADIGAAAHLTFRDQDGNVLVDGENVKTAGKGYQNNQFVVTLEFDAEGTEKFAQATQANIGKPLGIFMDDDEISAPNVQNAITDGHAIITGNFDTKSAEDLAAKIRAGSLPFSLKVISSQQVGALLGAEALSTSVVAGAIGIALVLLFMLIRYRLPGFCSDIALVIYTGILLVLMSLLGVTLTLPGVAGIVLSVGMAVDANVIIFERTKEEIKLGKSVKVAVKNGFAKAFSAIFDGNITTLISCAILFWLGTGPIKGFAQTLSLGIIVSMFTALVITRILLYSFINLGVRSAVLYGGFSKKEEAKFVEIKTVEPEKKESVKESSDNKNKEAKKNNDNKKKKNNKVSDKKVAEEKVEEVSKEIETKEEKVEEVSKEAEVLNETENEATEVAETVAEATEEELTEVVPEDTDDKEDE